MDKLLLYFNSLSKNERLVFCEDIGISESFLRKKISLNSLFHPKYCPKIEKITNGKVTCKDLRPDDWHLIWTDI